MHEVVSPAICSDSAGDVSSALDAYRKIPVDRSSIPQRVLDLENRARTNPFPWRGQFSPCLVETLLKHYAASSSVVLDPFAGVGTTMIEAARLGLSSCGTELNPAAVAMAESIQFLRMSDDERRRICAAARGRLDEALADAPLFSASTVVDSFAPTKIGRMIRDLPIGDAGRIVLTNALIRVLASTEVRTADAVFRAFDQHRSIVVGLPHSTARCDVFHSDARAQPISDGSIDLVLSSPPYINVFNYHQNNRIAMELLGWNLLAVARSEFGANRKHRGNRFLTVVQFCLDMRQTFQELRRVLREDGRAILVIGRESTVRGIAVENGRLVAAVASLTGFRLERRQERKFKTKFGELIYEDILHFAPHREGMGNDAAARDVARILLEESLPCAAPDVASDLAAAIEQSEDVRPSPCFNPGEARSA